MLRAVVLSAILAGAGAGLALSVVQGFAVVPAILAAESYEGSDVASEGPTTRSAGEHDHGAHGHGHDHGEAWAPEDGVVRTAFTALSNVATGIGFALLLCAAFALRGRITGREGVLWGLGGFVAFFVNPAFGLPPELPGTFAAALEARQLWWLLAVASSLAGLALVGLGKRWPSSLAGVGLLALPHVVGAPHPEVMGGLAPQALGHSFVTAAYLANGAFWVTLGLLSALAYGRLVRGATPAGR